MISIIIPNWDNLENLILLTQSIISCLEPQYHELLFIIQPIDDPRKDQEYKNKIQPFFDLLNKEGFFCRIHYPETNIGWTGAINWGLDKAEGDYLVMLNDDVILSPDCFTRMIMAMDIAEKELHSQVGLVGPVSNNVGGPQKIINWQYHPPTQEAVNQYSQSLNSPTDFTLTHFLSGFCILLNRKVYQDIGGLDDLFFPAGYDDNDLVLRAQAKGWKSIIANNVYIWHKGSPTLDKIPEIQRGMANRQKFIDKYWQSRKDWKPELIAVYRVRADEKYLEKSLKKVSEFADKIVLLVDIRHLSLAETWINKMEELKVKYSKIQTIAYIYPNEPFNERAERNLALKLGFDIADIEKDWMISIDGDEIPELTREDVERLMKPPNPHIKAYGFTWYNFWDSEEYFRIDDVWGNIKGARMFKIEPHQWIIRGTEQGLHCGNIPEIPNGYQRLTSFRILHYGYISREDRERKFNWYREIDQDKRPELIGGRGDYSHLISPTITLRKFQPKNDIGLCMIMKNEEKNVDKVLEHIWAFFREIVIIDTGSDDDSINRAKIYTPKIHSHPTNDFSEARNLALSYATTEWIFWLDFDEELKPEEWSKIRTLADNPEISAYWVKIINYFKDGGYALQENIRFHRREAGLWEGEVHEQFIVKDDLLTGDSDIVIHHYGYLENENKLREKAERYLKILKRERKKDPQNPDLWYREGMQYLNDGKWEKAERFLEYATRRGHPLAIKALGNHYLRKGKILWERIMEIYPPEHYLHQVAKEICQVLNQIIPQFHYIKGGDQ